MLQELARIIIILGIILVCFGSVLWLLGKLPFLGKLPGDVLVKRENFTLYIPVATTLLISLVFSAILTLIHWLKRPV